MTTVNFHIPDSLRDRVSFSDRVEDGKRLVDVTIDGPEMILPLRRKPCGKLAIGTEGSCEFCERSFLLGAARLLEAVAHRLRRRFLIRAERSACSATGRRAAE